MHGQFSWYDLMTPDAAASKRFYPAVTGWGTEEWDKADYTMWTAGGAPMGGMNPITPEQTAQGVSSHWLAYVTVDNVENAASTVRSFGGRVMHGPEDIPDVGRFAIIQDPQGAMLAIFKSSTPSPGFDGTPALGKFTWHELMTTDYQGAFDFYRQLFGWEKTGEMDMGPAGMYLMYGKNQKSFGGIYNREKERAHVAPNWLFYANVRDARKSADVAKQSGGRIVVGPMEIPGGDVVAVGIDPLGAPFAVHQTKARRTATKPKARPKPKAKAKAKTSARKKSKPVTKRRMKARPKKAARKGKR